MLPFIHIGSMDFATYGICLVTGFFVGYYILRAELKRRAIVAVPALEVVFALALCALVCSKLYLAVEDPGTYLLDPSLLLQRTGFTYYGGLIGDVIAVALLARRYQVPMLTLCDTLSVGCTFGFGIGRIGCFLAGDGDYGIPTSLPWGMSFPHGLVPTTQFVHPAPLYEFATSALIAIWLWRQGSPSRQPRLPDGEIFALFLIWTGAARFLVEFIKLNPPVFHWLVNAQLVAVISIVAGTVLYRVLHSTAARAPHRAKSLADLSEIPMSSAQRTEAS